MSRASDRYPNFPTELATEFNTACARITDIHTQIDALRAELRPLLTQREAALDLYAETTDDPTALLALFNTSRIASAKVEAHLRTLHPYMYSLNQYLMNDLDEHGNSTGDTIVLTGPHISLTHNRNNLSLRQAKPLAAALVKFAHTYVPNPIGLLPRWGIGDHTTMIQCDILTEHDETPVIWYTPDGTHAAYYPDTNNGHTGHENPITGTLADMLTRAINDAAREVSEWDW